MTKALVTAIAVAIAVVVFVGPASATATVAVGSKDGGHPLDRIDTTQPTSKSISQQFTDTYIHWNYGQKDGGHPWVTWYADIGDYWNKAGLLSVAVATSPGFSEAEGFYQESIVDYGYLDSYANPGEWVSSWKLEPGTYYVAVLMQWERNTYDDWDWTSRWVKADYPITVSPPAVTWNTCSNAIWVAKDQWNLGRGTTSCKPLTGNFQVTHRFKNKGHKQTYVFSVRLTGHHSGTARYLRTWGHW